MITSDQNIRNMEARTMNAWPSFQTLQFDGWILRFAEGYTKRANSINPLYYSTKDINKKIEICEQIFTNHNLPVVYKLTNQTFPKNLDNLLIVQDYSKIDETSVQILLLNRDFPESKFNIECSHQISETWLTAFCNLNHLSPSNRAKLEKILLNIILTSYFVLLKKNEEVIACGLGVQEDEYIGCFDIVVSEKYRNQGIGMQLMNEILRTGQKNHATIGYLQVMKNNPAALKLYSKLGFKEIYSYWYRIKDLRKILLQNNSLK